MHNNKQNQLTMSGLLKSKAFYFGASAGLLSAVYLKRQNDKSTNCYDVIDNLNKTDRLAGMDWKPPTRAQLINRLKGQHFLGNKRLSEEDATFDLLIIGGGATGTGCALDAAARGLKVACVEKGDFSCGKTIHM